MHALWAQSSKSLERLKESSLWAARSTLSLRSTASWLAGHRKDEAVLPDRVRVGDEPERVRVESERADNDDDEAEGESPRRRALRRE